MKPGTKIVCIKDFLSEGTLIFKMDEYYIINSVENYYDKFIIKIENYWFSGDFIVNEENYFYNFFDTLVEFREKRINKILE